MIDGTEIDNDGIFIFLNQNDFNLYKKFKSLDRRLNLNLDEEEIY